MRHSTLTVCTLLAIVALSGCTVCHNACRTLCVEPSEFNWKADHVESYEVYAGWADAAWASSGMTDAACKSPHYVQGFRDGFIDFVYAGGNGEPPAAPPRELWKAGWRTESGKAAADNWFAGYRHGATMAREGGYRDEAVVPTSLDTF